MATMGFEKQAVSDDVQQLEAAPGPRYTAQETKRVLRKVDTRLLPMLALLYVIAFLDRGNIGNTKVAGMNTDLDLSGSQYNLALTVFFLPYAVFEVPSNIMLKFLRPSLWIAALVISWGTVMTLAGIVHNFNGLVLSRFFLGLTETGFFPAASYLLTTWYVRFELQTRLAIFFSAGAFGGAFSGLLAAAIEKMDGIAGLEGWRWIFIIEGIFTVTIGFTLPWTLPDSPQRATFLDQTEKAIIEHRLFEDSGPRHEPFKWIYLKNALLEWRIYISVIVYSGNSIALYAFIYAAPSIIFEMGYTDTQAQLMTVPLYLVGMVSCVSFAILSDKYRCRWLFIVIPYTLAMIGFLGCLVVPHPRLSGLTYGLLFFIPMGVYPPLMGTVAWVANNLSPSWKRAIGMALLISIGNFGGAIGSNLFLQKQKPRYWLGYGFCTANVVCSILAAMFLRFSWGRENARRGQMDQREIKARYTEAELEEMGDKSPLFEYAL